MKTGLCDKNGTEINIGDRTKLVLEDGEVREFDVQLKTVTRVVKCHPDFDDEYSKVNITGVVFSWNGYDLFPCVDDNGVSDVSKMEVIEGQYRGTCDYCDEENQVLRGTPFIADIPAKMCRRCWDMTQKEYIASEETDIGDFDS